MAKKQDIAAMLDPFEADAAKKAQLERSRRVRWNHGVRNACHITGVHDEKQQGAPDSCREGLRAEPKRVLPSGG